MENESPSPWRFQFVLQQPDRLLAGIWGALGLLLLVSFLLPNYSMALMELNGLDVIRMVFKDTDHLRKMFDDSSYFLLVAVPVSYLALAVLIGFVAALLWLGKGGQWVLVATTVALVVMILSIIGLFVIGNDARDVPFIGKLMPQTIYGYHLALILVVLAFLVGLGHLVLKMQNRVKPS